MTASGASLNNDNTVEYEFHCGSSFTTCKMKKIENSNVELGYVIAEKEKEEYKRSTVWRSTFQKTKQWQMVRFDKWLGSERGCGGICVYVCKSGV